VAKAIKFRTVRIDMSKILTLLLLGSAIGSEDSWEKLSDGPWSAREGLMAVSAGSKIFMTGGRTSSGLGFAGDVWSTENGTEWQQVNANAFPKRAYHNMVALKGCLYVMGGQTFSTYMNDVWKSCDEGKSWTSLGNATWPVRAGGAATVYEGNIIVAGGCYSGGSGGLGPPKRLFRGDVWSSPDGVEWTQLSEQAEWSARSGPRLVPFQDKLFIVAGERGFTAGVQLKDIWSSTNGGKNWTLASANPGFSARSGHGVEISPDGKEMLVVAGWPELHDIWKSTDGATFTQTSDLVWECSKKSCGKFDFWSLFHKGEFYTIGGSGASATFGKLYSDTWVADTL
jgi:hypothetical protein